MLYYDRIDVSVEIDVKSKSKEECNICCYCYFLSKGFKFQPNVCNGCHDLSVMYMNLSDLAISNFKAADYLCVINRISKSEAINLMQNVDLTEESRIENKIYYHIKMDTEMLIFGDIEIEKDRYLENISM